MTDNAQSIEIAEIIFTLQILIEHQQELLAEGKAQGQTNDEHVKQISAMIRQLTELLKTYQDNAQSITDNTIQSIKNTISVAFEKNQESYHALINKGFTTHIDTATKKLSTVADKVGEELENIKVAATNSKTEFKERQGFFKLYENTYDDQSKKLKESVEGAVTAIIKDTKDKLEDIGSDFSDDLAKKLSWKVTMIFSAVCFSIVLFTFGLSWLFVPSKAEISDRQADYDELAKAQVMPSITKRADGYYARIDSKTCIDNPDSYPWNKSLLCKIK
ncbi:hypothetical protein H0262_13050 [Psychrobacter cryohalolentis]|uniref:hypothetical protein n=1 Tax=Psychrobacter sp. D2 TaxID=2759702 RepID=UPI0015E5A920|nr:hypothetical protein [Psychrobacter sp. D2]MBA2058789.1 hypothetical protein [Psychrobacter sp. D2]